MRALRKIWCRFGWHDYARSIGGRNWTATQCGDCHQSQRIVMADHSPPEDVADAITDAGAALACQHLARHTAHLISRRVCPSPANAHLALLCIC